MTTTNIFVKSMNGNTLNFIVDQNQQRVKDLIKKYSQKSGMKTQQIYFVHAGKILGGNMTQKSLYQLDIRDGSIIYAIGRLKGGKTLKVKLAGANGTQYDIQIDDDKTGYQLKQYIYNKLTKSLNATTMCLRFAGVQIQNDKKLSSYKIYQQKGIVKIIQEKQNIGRIAGIILAYEQDPLGLDQETTRMPCGHVIGRDGMTQFVRSLISSNCYQVKCPASKPDGKDCDFQWDFSLCRKIGVFTKQQVQQFQEGLSLNWIRQQSSQCPKCQFRVFKGELKSNRVICPKCGYGDYCYSCCHKWLTNNMDLCGNPNCKQLNKILQQSQWSKQFELNTDGVEITYNLPQIRACPNPVCHATFQHDKGCKHASCKQCKTNFCWVCLEIKTGSNWPCKGPWDYCGKIAPVQKFEES